MFGTDIQSLPGPAGERVWWPICFWADPLYTAPTMQFAMVPDDYMLPPPDRAYTLELLHVPDGASGAPPVGTTWNVPADAPFTLVLPTFATNEGLDGYWFAFHMSCAAGGCICRGDANCDGTVSWRDIDYFIAGMNDNQAGWEALFPPGQVPCPFANLDVNADGTVSWRDIDPLVRVMNTACE